MSYSLFLVRNGKKQKFSAEIKSQLGYYDLKEIFREAVDDVRDMLTPTEKICRITKDNEFILEITSSNCNEARFRKIWDILYYRFSIK